MCLDLYLSKLKEQEYQKIKPQIKTSTTNQMPLLSWDIYMAAYHKRMKEAKRKTELKKVRTFANRFNWKNDLDAAFAEHEYEALIITDLTQTILWVNEGFTTMTGYSKKFALNKTPKFLQGKKTSIASKNNIKEKITQGRPFKEIIINYKKDKTPYTCEVKIIPLYNEKTTHFIAFEKQIV